MPPIRTPSEKAPWRKISEALDDILQIVNCLIYSVFSIQIFLVQICFLFPTVKLAAWRHDMTGPVAYTIFIAYFV